MLAVYFMKGIVVAGDAVVTANNIFGHEALFRLGFATGVIGTAIYIALTALLYGLFRPVSRNLSLLAAFFSLVGCAIQACGNIFQLAPFALLGSGQHPSGFTLEQSQTLALTLLNLNVQATYVCLVFFGFFDFFIGCLILRSNFLPRFLGALMALAGLGWLTFLSPPFGTQLSPYNLALGFVAELFLLLWLLVKGVNEQRWKEQAGAKGEW